MVELPIDVHDFPVLWPLDLQNEPELDSIVRLRKIIDGKGADRRMNVSMVSNLPRSLNPAPLIHTC